MKKREIRYRVYINTKLYERACQREGERDSYRNYCLGRRDEIVQLAVQLLGIDVTEDINRAIVEVHNGL